MIFQFETFIYNTFVFPVETKLEIEFDQQYDQADRTVVATKHFLRATVTLKTDTMAGQTVNGVELVGNNEADLPVIKAALTKPGQKLVLTNTGFGDLSVNGESQKQDSSWGPKPRSCSFLPLGTDACVLRWSCEVMLPTCIDAVFTNTLMAYNYAVSVSVDEQGYCTRTITGYYEIPLTRNSVGGDSVSQSALDYWGPQTIPPVPTNFRRLTTETNESEDRRKLHFRVVDTETNDVILPPNVVECRASHSVQTADKALKRMIATLRASYTMRKGVSKQDAFICFLYLLLQKWRAQIDSGARGGDIQASSIVPISLTLEDPDIYGRAAGNFSMTWSYVNGDPSQSENVVDMTKVAKNLIPNTALWIPGVKRGGTVVQSPNNNSWSLWRQSMNSVFGSNVPKFKYSAGDDIILDLCGSGATPKVRGQFFRVADSGAGPASLNVPVADKSFIKYNTALQVQNDSGIVFRRAPNVLKGSAGDVAAAGAGTQLLGGVGTIYWLAKKGADLLGDVQEIGGPGTMAILSYDIIQVGSPPAPPVLSRVGDVQAIYQKSGKHTNYLHAVLFGVPAYGLEGWDVYFLKTSPGNLPNFPPNYFLGDNNSYPNSPAAEGLAL